MLIAAEVLVVLLLAWGAWRTWRAGAGPAAHAVVGVGIGLAAALTVITAAALATRGLDNLVTRAVLLLALSLTTAGIARWWWNRDAARRVRWDAAFTRRPRVAIPTLAAVLVLQGALALLLATIAVNLVVRRWPAADPVLRMRTVLARHLLIGEPSAPARAVAPLDQQRQLIGGMGRLFARGRDAAADATGMRAALEAIDVLRELGSLDPAAKLWLARNQPALGRLVDHPGLRALASDQAVLDEIARVAQGNLAAAWRLGERAEVQALFADRAIAAAVAGIDLSGLRSAWRTRAADGMPVPVAWRLGIGSAEPLDAEAGVEALSCPPGAGALRLLASLEEPEAGDYLLRLSGLDAPRLSVDGEPCALIGSDGELVAWFTLAAPGDWCDLRIEAAGAPSGRIGLALSGPGEVIP